MLTGGHPNSLGRTTEVVEKILENPELLENLYQCYFSRDEVVRLRTSNAFKRVAAAHFEWLVPYVDKFLNEVSAINQASAQWTLAQLFGRFAPLMTESQTKKAVSILKRNLAEHSDWIVLNHTMQTLSDWSVTDKELRRWLEPQLVRLSQDSRKSVAGRAKKLIKSINSPDKGT